VVGGALSNGGNLLEWLRSTLQVPNDLGELERAVEALEPDGHGLTFLPFLAGERSTGWHSEARAAITGMSLNTRPIEIVRAGYEEVAYRFGMIHALLREAIPGIGPVTASGGALLHSPMWMQMMADVLGYPVMSSAVAEASSRGAAVLALEAIGALAALKGLTRQRGRHSLLGKQTGSAMPRGRHGSRRCTRCWLRVPGLEPDRDAERALSIRGGEAGSGTEMAMVRLGSCQTARAQVYTGLCV